MSVMGDLTVNFSRAEFRCDDCGRLDLLDQGLIAVLQRIRTAVGRPLVINSGYRCCARNAAVGGIRFSQHLFGRAADFSQGYCRPDLALRSGAVGVGVRNGWVVHIDVEPGRKPHTFQE